MLCFGLVSSTKLRPHDIPSAADVAVPDFSLAKTIGKIEGQLEEGNFPDLEDDLIPGAGSEIGAGGSAFYCPFLTAKRELDFSSK